VISMKDAWKLENKNPTQSFTPSNEKVIDYIKTVADGAAQSAVQMLVVVDLPANKTSIFVLPKSMCFIANSSIQFASFIGGPSAESIPRRRSVSIGAWN